MGISTLSKVDPQSSRRTQSCLASQSHSGIRRAHARDQKYHVTHRDASRQNTVIAVGVFVRHVLTMPRTEADRFWGLVRNAGVEGDGCWEWGGSRLATGYGQFRRSSGKVWRTHRVSWELSRGPIPDGLCVLHDCDNPACVRPDHLFLGTLRDNAIDMGKKGRAAATVLTSQNLADLPLLIEMGVTQAEIARRFGVSRQRIQQLASADK